MDVPRILIVEDNGDDVALIRRAFKHCKIVNPLSVVADGDSAVAYLSGSGPYADRTAHPLPALVMLDLKLPRLRALIERMHLYWLVMNESPGMHATG